MWEIIGSWFVLISAVLVGAAALVLGWWRGERRLTTALVATLAGVIATLGLVVAVVTPVSADGATCTSRATPYGVNHVDVDAATAAETGIDRFACRDALRTRYLMGLVGFLVVTLVAGTAIGRSRRLVG